MPSSKFLSNSLFYIDFTYILREEERKNKCVFFLIQNDFVETLAPAENVWRFFRYYIYFKCNLKNECIYFNLNDQ